MVICIWANNLGFYCTPNLRYAASRKSFRCVQVFSVEMCSLIPYRNPPQKGLVNIDMFGGKSMV